MYGLDHDDVWYHDEFVEIMLNHREFDKHRRVKHILLNLNQVHTIVASCKCVQFTAHS